MKADERAGLRAAVAVPIIYYGAQLVSMPFYPGYSVIRHQASVLGSDGSRLPIVFNAGALLGAIALAVAAWGMVEGLRRLGAGKSVAYLTGVVVFSGALSSLSAALFPLPDPRHGSGVLAQLGYGFILVPALLPVALWKARSRLLRWYLLANLGLHVPLVVVVMAPGIRSAALQDALTTSPGLFQRVLSATLFVPIGVCGYVLLKRHPQAPDASLAP